jgi:hypothetical protein
MSTEKLTRPFKVKSENIKKDGEILYYQGKNPFHLQQYLFLQVI